MRDWRDLMPDIREIVWEWAGEGRVEVLQRGRVVEEDGVRGPIRVRLRRAETGNRDGG